MKIAVCIEGNPTEDLFAVRMEKLCKRILLGTELYFYHDRKLFLKHLPEHTYDLVYLNIKGGIREACSTLLKLRELDERVPVFYVTEYWRYIEKLCDIGAVAIIRKPFEKGELIRTLAGEETEREKAEFYFEYDFRRKRHRIRISEILYFESEGRNIIIHLERNRSSRFIGRLDEIEKRMHQNGQSFVRSHQSYLIRSAAIRRYDSGEVRLKNNEILPVSQKKREMLRAHLQTIH